MPESETSNQRYGATSSDILLPTKQTLRLPHQAHIEAAFKAEAEGMERQAGSPENIEAIMAFMEKRAPKFR